MDDRERLLACLAVKAGFIDASAARLGAAMGHGLLVHLERAGALTAKRRELLIEFAAEATAARGSAAAVLHALLDPTEPIPADTGGGLGDDDDEPTRALGGTPALTPAHPPAPAQASAPFDDDDEPTRALGNHPKSAAPAAQGFADDDDEATAVLPPVRPSGMRD